MSKKYSEQWNIIFLIMNTEAVIFILLSLGGQDISMAFGGTKYSILAGVFSIYVILSQYYVNGLNYNERALKAHYHQLDIEDLILQLEGLFVKLNRKDNKLEESQSIEKYNEIMFKYQIILKNNENHETVDYRRNKSKSQESKKQKENKEDAEEENSRKKIRDFNLDNIFIKCNFLIIFLLLLLIIWAFV